MDQTKILFLCIHNSARSQMAEAYLEKFGGEKFLAESAGLEAGILNPLAVEVMQEEGIDISNKKTKDVFEFFKEGRLYQYVVTVCDEANSARCPNALCYPAPAAPAGPGHGSTAGGARPVWRLRGS